MKPFFAALALIAIHVACSQMREESKPKVIKIPRTEDLRLQRTQDFHDRFWENQRREREIMDNLRR